MLYIITIDEGSSSPSASGSWLESHHRLRDVPTLHHRQQEAVPDEPLAMRAREISGTHGDDSVLLEFSKDGQGVGQLLWVCRHRAERSLAYCVS